ncbi:glycosyltransferase family 4 protein [Tateyamaria omphalii]|uniref:glycosyltransferase family 4 protein n=1 Tax=Tateyamaria omphalii TaxID=299262 RepID=UPI001C993999|nr:glycosyltransferase family 4 protein [Tateyamaria omphalii]MBY5935324.1 glycosyltransferase family 4 protein [Tateyamaria omphalii]
MTVAFYAPLKAPDHPVPSGDRTMARALIRALEHAGFATAIPSDVRIYDGRGDSLVQADLTRQAKTEVARILALPDARTWRCWLTYHNYYKAPDLIGPAVAQALGLPYIQIESTRARKRLSGPWAAFAAAAEAASDQAHTIFYVTERDAETLRRDAPDGQILTRLPPFLPIETLPSPSDHSGAMLSVGMMRNGDKLASYALIADTLERLEPGLDWRLDIVGDGPAQAEVVQLMAPFGARVKMLGALSTDALQQLYAKARLLFWPGVNEAFGYAYLEAQAAGLPVVAQDRPGVRDVVEGVQPTVTGGPDAMAARLNALLTQPDLHHAAAADARQKMQAHHLLPAAADALRTGIGAAI